ncbi:MAG: MBL fold metallo-hydrolase, partial [Candidatus Omnitrophica bacterium]|nr:MBL fold metallo-hydrolase [Candidatus Omnitrophota bacterium]
AKDFTAKNKEVSVLVRSSEGKGMQELQNLLFGGDLKRAQGISLAVVYLFHIIILAPILGVIGFTLLAVKNVTDKFSEISQASNLREKSLLPKVISEIAETDPKLASHIGDFANRHRGAEISKALQAVVDPETQLSNRQIRRQKAEELKKVAQEEMQDRWQGKRGGRKQDEGALSDKDIEKLSAQEDSAGDVDDNSGKIKFDDRGFLGLDDSKKDFTLDSGYKIIPVREDNILNLPSLYSLSQKKNCFTQEIAKSGQTPLNPGQADDQKIMAGILSFFMQNRFPVLVPQNKDRALALSLAGVMAYVAGKHWSVYYTMNGSGGVAQVFIKGWFSYIVIDFEGHFSVRIDGQENLIFNTSSINIPEFKSLCARQEIGTGINITFPDNFWLEGKPKGHDGEIEMLKLVVAAKAAVLLERKANVLQDTNPRALGDFMDNCSTLETHMATLRSLMSEIDYEKWAAQYVSGIAAIKDAKRLCREALENRCRPVVPPKKDSDKNIAAQSQDTVIRIESGTTQQDKPIVKPKAQEQDSDAPIPFDLNATDKNQGAPFASLIKEIEKLLFALEAPAELLRPVVNSKQVPANSMQHVRTFVTAYNQIKVELPKLKAIPEAVNDYQRLCKKLEPYRKLAHDLSEMFPHKKPDDKNSDWGFDEDGRYEVLMEAINTQGQCLSFVLKNNKWELCKCSVNGKDVSIESIKKNYSVLLDKITPGLSDVSSFIGQLKDKPFELLWRVRVVNKLPEGFIGQQGEFSVNGKQTRATYSDGELIITNRLIARATEGDIAPLYTGWVHEGSKGENAVEQHRQGLENEAWLLKALLETKKIGKEVYDAQMQRIADEKNKLLASTVDYAIAIYLRESPKDINGRIIYEINPQPTQITLYDLRANTKARLVMGKAEYASAKSAPLDLEATPEDLETAKNYVKKILLNADMRKQLTVMLNPLDMNYIFIVEHIRKATKTLLESGRFKAFEEQIENLKEVADILDKNEVPIEAKFNGKTQEFAFKLHLIFIDTKSKGFPRAQGSKALTSLPAISFLRNNANGEDRHFVAAIDDVYLKSNDFAAISELVTHEALQTKGTCKSEQELSNIYEPLLNEKMPSLDKSGRIVDISAANKKIALIQRDAKNTKYIELISRDKRYRAILEEEVKVAPVVERTNKLGISIVPLCVLLFAISALAAIAIGIAYFAHHPGCLTQMAATGMGGFILLPNNRLSFMHHIKYFKKALNKSDSVVAQGKIKIIPLGGIDGPGESAFIIEVNGKRILLDAGFDPRTGKTMDFQNVEGQIDYILLSHAHLDHTGSLIEAAAKFYSAKIIATASTFEIAEILIKDAFRKKHLHDIRSRYLRADFGKWYNLGDEIKIKFTPAGHILGAVLITIATPYGNIVYSGDVSDETQSSVGPMQLPQIGTDFLITEALYGDKAKGSSRQVRKKQFAVAVSKALKRGGSVLIPAFAVGRSTEIALILKEYQLKGIIPAVNIYIDGMAAAMTKIYEKYINKTIFAAKSNIIEINRKNRGLMADVYEPHIIIAGSGMLKGGCSMRYFAEMAGNPLNAVFIVGYATESSLASRIMDFGKGQIVRLRLSKEEIVDVDVNAEIKKFAFSAHAYQEGLTATIHGINPKALILVHASEGAKGALVARLKNESFAADILITRINEEIRLPVYNRENEFTNICAEALPIPEQKITFQKPKKDLFTTEQRKEKFIKDILIDVFKVEYNEKNIKVLTSILDKDYAGSIHRMRMFLLNSRLGLGSTQNMADKLWEELKNTRRIFGTNTSFGEGVLFRHMKVDDIIAAFPKKIINLGSHYERRPIEEHISTIMEEDKEFSQEITKMCQDKLFAALERLEKKAKWRAGLVEIFKKKVTVVVVKTPTKFLLSGRDKRKIFYQLTHLGLKRWIIYIPLELFKEVNLDVKVDLDMFA